MNSNNLILSCCGQVFTSYQLYKGHSDLHVCKLEQVRCPYPFCNHLTNKTDQMTNHLLTNHKDVPKHILGLEEPPVANLGDVMYHTIKNNLPITKNLFSLPEYKNNPIVERYLDDLNDISRSESEIIGQNLVEDFENEFQYEVQSNEFDVDQVSVHFDNILDEETRQQATNSFDQFSFNEQLTDLQKKLADGYNDIKNSNSITDAALKAACKMVTNVLSDHLNLNPIIKQQCDQIVESDHLLQQRRNSVRYECQRYADQDPIYYFKIKDYLIEILNNDLIWSKLIYEKNKERDNRIIESIHDLDSVKKMNGQLQKDELNVYFNLWFDDFNTSSRVFGNTDLSVVLLSLAGIDYKFTSKRHSAGLIALSKKATREKVGIIKFFEQIKSQIIDINKEPIIFKGYKIYFRFFCCKCDNKAANEMIVNISGCFIGEACKFCKAKYSELDGSRTFEKRPLSSGHVFDGCEFVTSWLYACDVFHDICEGVIIRLFNNLLRNCTKIQLQKYVDDCIKLDNKFGKRFRMSSFKIRKYRKDVLIGGTGIQKLHFFYLFSLLNFTVPTSSEEFKIYNLFRKIVDFIFTDKVYKAEIPAFRESISRFIHGYIRTFGQFEKHSIPFKIHHLEHYPDLILEFGILSNVSTLSSERTLQLLSRAVEGSRNCLNLPLSIAKSFNFKIESLFNLEIISELMFSQVPKTYHQYFPPSTDHQSKILDLSSITIENTRIVKSGLYLVKMCDNNTKLPVFMKVLKLYYFNNQPVIIGRIVLARTFTKRYLAYGIHETNQEYKFQPNQIIFHKPLYWYKYKDNLFVMKTFHVFFYLNN